MYILPKYLPPIKQVQFIMINTCNSPLVFTLLQKRNLYILLMLLFSSNNMRNCLAMSTKDAEAVRKASLPSHAGGMSDMQLRHYNNPNNDESVFSDDPVYVACPELRDKMRSRTLKREEYEAAKQDYTAERIMLLVEQDIKYMRAKREEMLKKSIEASRP